MGFKITWIGCKHKSLETVLADLRLRRTGERGDCSDARYACLKLPNEWSIIINNHTLDDKIIANNLYDFRKTTEVVFCNLNENAMTSSVSMYVDGAETWSVIHDAKVAIDHLGVRGDVPRQTFLVYASLLDKPNDQNELNYIIEVPIILAGSITGFRHDRISSGMIFDVVERVPPLHPNQGKTVMRKIHNVWRDMTDMFS